MIDSSKEKDQFQAILQIMVTSLIEMIKKSENTDEKEAVNRLYASELYKTLENEETKLWRLSVPALFDLYMEEKSKGRIIFPEET